LAAYGGLLLIDMLREMVVLGSTFNKAAGRGQVLDEITIGLAFLFRLLRTPARPRRQTGHERDRRWHQGRPARQGRQERRGRRAGRERRGRRWRRGWPRRRGGCQ